MVRPSRLDSVLQVRSNAPGRALGSGDSKIHHHRYALCAAPVYCGAFSRDCKYEDAAIKIVPNIVPVEPHQATVSKVIGFLNGRWHLQGIAKGRRGAGRQRQPREYRLG